MRRWFSSQVHICLVGAFVLSIGISSLVSMIFGWMNGTGSFGFGFLLIFIGLGLLRGSALQRSLFGGLLALGLVVIVLMLIVSLVQGTIFSGELNWKLAGMLTVFLGFYFYGFFVLWDARNDSWFAEKFSGKAPAFVVPITVALSLFYSLTIELNNYLQKSAFAEIFPYDLEIKVTDAKSGEALERVSFSQKGSEFSDLEVPEWMTGSSSSTSASEDVTLVIKGYERGPFDIRIGAEGYEDQSVTINRLSQSPIEVKLEALPKK